MKHILSLILIMLSVLIASSSVGLDSINRIVLYPPIYVDSATAINDKYSLTKDSVMIISNDRYYFYLHRARFCRSIFRDSAEIHELIELLSKLQYIRDLGYSNSNDDLAAVLELDSIGHPSWRVLNAPILGQIIISHNDVFEIIWLTAEGVEIDCKLYAYSTELNLYFREIIRKHKQMNPEK